MTGAAITQPFERLGRLTAATRQKAGDGTAWDYTFPDGETHRYVIRGLKSHAEAEDSAFNLLVDASGVSRSLVREAKRIAASTAACRCNSPYHSLGNDTNRTH